MTASQTRTIRVSDITGQLNRKAKILPGTQVKEVVDSLVPVLDLPSHDPDGRPISYHARLERTGELLGEDVEVAETVREDDKLELLPEITPGR